MKILAAAVWALALATLPAQGACRYGHCVYRHRLVHPHGSGRALSPIGRASRSASPRVNTPTFTERPVQPGAAPLPAYLPNNAPPVFAPQPIP